VRYLEEKVHDSGLNLSECLLSKAKCQALNPKREMFKIVRHHSGSCVPVGLHRTALTAHEDNQRVEYCRILISPAREKRRRGFVNRFKDLLQIDLSKSQSM
jgi:hypothetical protein